MENITSTPLIDETIKINLFYAILVAVVCFLTVIGNSATIYAFWKVPGLREKPSEFLILNLSVADLMTGLLAIPLVSPMYITPGNWPLGESGCRFIVFPFNLSIHTSLGLLLAISIDRFLLVYLEYPKYLKIQSQARINFIIACCWGFAALTVVIEQSVWDVAKGLDEVAANINYDRVCLSPPRRLQSFSISFFLGLYFTPVVLVCGFSLAFLCLLRKRLIKNKVRQAPQSTTGTVSSAPSHENQPQPDQSATGGSQGESRSRVRNRYIKPALSLIALVFGMAVCMLPYSLYVIIIELFCPKCNNIPVLFNLLFLQFCNACLDPFLYALTQRKIQKLYCSCLKGRSAQA